MKVTIDNLVRNADRIQSQRNSSVKERSGTVKGDSAQIAGKIDARADALSGDLRETQTELSKNQVIKEGLSAIIEEMNAGKNTAETVQNTTFNGKKVLLDYLGQEEGYTQNFLAEKQESINDLVRENINKLTKLQVEAENISASNMAQNKDMDKLIQNTADTASLSKAYSSANLNADMVSRLIR